MKISYLITCSTETDSLERLLYKISNVVPYKDDEVIVLYDTDSISPVTSTIIYNYERNFRILAHSLDKNYGGHKNWGATNCTGDFIFQIDGDELPGDYVLGENLHTIIESNPNIDLMFVPRINDFRGVDPEIAKPWGWRLTEKEFYRPCEDKRVKSLVVNFPDFQGRIFRNIPELRWDRRLHEKLEGYKSWVRLPEEEDYCLYHDKTIETQINTNIRYNQWFTEEENRGHNVFDVKNNRL